MENQQKSLDYNRIMNVILFLLLILAISKCNKTNGELVNQTNLVNNLNDSLKTWVDESGNHRAKMEILEATSIKNFTTIKNQSSEIQRLQNLVTKNKNTIKNSGSATIISTEGSISTTVPTIPSDTSKTKCSESHIYASNFNLKGWVKGNIVARKDSTSISLKYRDSIDVVLGEEKTGFLGLGKKKPFADLTSYNPYTEVKTFRTFQVKQKPVKKFGIGPTFSYGFGTGSLKPQFFVGIGGQYNLINF